MSILGPDGDRYALVCGNNRDHYARVGKVDAIITDPPYGAEVHVKERVGRENGSDGAITNSPIPFDALTLADVEALVSFASTNNDGWAVMFCQTEQTELWRLQSRPGMRYVRPMIWVKPDAKPNMNGNGPGVGHETMAAFWCGTNRQSWNGGGKVGIFHFTKSVRKEEGENRHPTMKPVPLMKELIRLFTDPGDIVFDPFMGSGSTGVAALELGRRFLGIEKDETYFAEAARRIGEVVVPDLVFASDAKMPPLFGKTEFPGRCKNERLRKAAQEKENADNLS